MDKIAQKQKGFLEQFKQDLKVDLKLQFYKNTVEIRPLINLDENPNAPENVYMRLELDTVQHPIGHLFGFSYGMARDAVQRYKDACRSCYENQPYYEGRENLRKYALISGVMLSLVERSRCEYSSEKKDRLLERYENPPRKQYLSVSLMPLDDLFCEKKYGEEKASSDNGYELKESRHFWMNYANWCLNDKSQEYKLEYECHNHLDICFAILDYIMTKQYNFCWCPICKKYFLRESESRVRYCSDECRKQYDRNRKTNVHLSKLQKEMSSIYNMIIRRKEKSLDEDGPKSERYMRAMNAQNEFVQYRAEVNKQIADGRITEDDALNLMEQYHKKLKEDHQRKPRTKRSEQ